MSKLRSIQLTLIAALALSLVPGLSLLEASAHHGKKHHCHHHHHLHLLCGPGGSAGGVIGDTFGCKK
jgi:hypothetical protein